MASVRQVRRQELAERPRNFSYDYASHSLVRIAATSSVANDLRELGALFYDRYEQQRCGARSLRTFAHVYSARRAIAFSFAANYREKYGRTMSAPPHKAAIQENRDTYCRPDLITTRVPDFALPSDTLTSAL